jgi:cytochrome bd ubiquinol oxidase subunit II
VTLADVIAALMLGGLMVYALLAGADFGGGVWDLLATGPRAAAQRALVERAIAPVWEANHVWLIFVVVLLFTGFPAAYAALGVALHVPITAVLVGIVFRGAAFTFRHYHDDAGARLVWGRVFAVASLVTPVFLGVIVGAVTAGDVRTAHPDYFGPWLAVFPFAVGLFTLALFAFLAAVYLTRETDDPALENDFRVRALLAGLATGASALLAAVTATGPGTRHFADHFLGSWWTWPLQIATGAVAVGALAALWARRFRVARALAGAQVALILLGWGLAQHPYLIAPDVTIDGAAAPPATLVPLLWASIAGAVILVPSIYWLFRVFKR